MRTPFTIVVTEVVETEETPTEAAE